MDILGYYVSVRRNGKLLWLQDDETTWNDEHLGAQEFTSADLAYDIGERECEADDILFVYGLLHNR